MAHEIIFIKPQNPRPEDKHITPGIISEVSVGGDYPLRLHYQKVSSVSVFISINNEPMGFVWFKNKNTIRKFYEEIKAFSRSPFYPIAPQEEIMEHKEKLIFGDCLAYKEIENTITLFTLASLVELYFPTNWLILLPEEDE